MPGRLRSSSCQRSQPLGGHWELASCEPGAVADLTALEGAALSWVRCSGPMTAAAALREAGVWHVDGVARRFDAEDWWYRVRFSVDAVEHAVEQWLCFDGLATIADVWLNGEPLLSVNGMFTAHERRVDAQLRAENVLVMRFHALDAALTMKRPRPRWRVPMLEAQQLRWFRTTLLGRTPGWSPPAAAVGPWRDIRLEVRTAVAVEQLVLRADGDGTLDVGIALRAIADTEIHAATVAVTRGAARHEFPVALAANGVLHSHRVVVPHVAQWWPHTHGDPALYHVALTLATSRGPCTLDLGHVGFRTIDVRRDDGDFAVVVNGVPVFCRGACWTPLDVVSLGADEGQLPVAFDQLVDAGLNMVRVGGMMVYESDAFLDACDARGVLLWQDLMFANMDYPEEDPAFLHTVHTEVRQQLTRLSGRPSVAVVCGNSEGAQQAAMWGAGRERWSPALFHQEMPALVAQLLPEVVYWPSSTHGGDFPHQGDVGTTSYFGVGAYRRPLEDARRAEVRFATECLAFANIPGAAGLAAMCADEGASGVPVRSARWRERSPRDRGATWDFDDVRDHYVALLSGADPAALCAADEAHYLELSRELPGEVMARTMGEWRRARSVTRGALIWFLRDLWPGAGWGIIDATGQPKAAWYHLRRACAPVAVHISDEGGNGLALHVANDGACALTAQLDMTLWRDGEVAVGRGAREVTVPAHGSLELNAAALLDAFYDLSYAYRFGPPPLDLVSVRLVAANGAVLASAVQCVGPIPTTREADLGLTAHAHRDAAGVWWLTVRTRRAALGVYFAMPGFRGSDEHFHLAPGDVRTLHLIPRDMAHAALSVSGTVHAVNAATATSVVTS